MRRSEQGRRKENVEQKWEQKIKAEGVPHVLELIVSQAHIRKSEAKKEETKPKKKVVGWSTEEMEEKTSKRELKDTEEMVQWRSINQEGIQELRGKMEEEVLEKYKFEENHKGDQKGKSEPLEWRIVQRVNEYIIYMFIYISTLNVV